MKILSIFTKRVLIPLYHLKHSDSYEAIDVYTELHDPDSVHAPRWKDSASRV